MGFSRYIQISLELWGGFFCLIAALTTYIIEKKENSIGEKILYMLISAAILLFSDSVAWLYRGAEGMVGFYMVRISNFMVFVMGYVISMIFTSYITAYLERIGKIDRSWGRFNYLIGTVGICLMVFSQFNHMYYYFDAENYYHRAPLYGICLMIGLMEMLIYGVILARYHSYLKRKDFILFSSYIAFPTAALLIQYVWYGISFTNIAIMIVVLIIFISSLTERSLQLAKQERKMGEMQIQLVLSQIQPHFIYNSLNSIYYLCEKDPKRAQMAVNWFAELLRSNMDSMKRNTPVAFDTELHALDNYLKLEKMRFDEELQVQFDIQSRNFMLPPMTLQPIVENAVKHGLGPKPGGGTVTISSCERESGFEVVIADDGVGYDPAKNRDDGRTHTGLENVEKRLWSMCGGRIDINGRKGEGTTVVIWIPKEKKEHGNHSSR